MLVSVERLCFQIVPCLVVGAASCRDSLLSRQPTFAAGCQMQRDYGPQRRGHMSLKELEVEIRPVGFSAMDSTRDSFQSISATSSRKSKDMKQADYPKGWDEDRVKRVLAHYDNQSEEEAIAEDEAAWEDSSQTFMKIPNDLVPVVSELLARREGVEESRSKE